MTTARYRPTTFGPRKLVIQREFRLIKQTVGACSTWLAARVQPYT